MVCACVVYLFFGLVLMLLLVANVYDVPELNLGRYFYLRTEEGDASERQHLHSPAADVDRQPPRYTTASDATSEQDTASGAATKRSKKADDKRRLTDDSL